ncbi:MAG: glycoside hydrolase/phage tail family protein [Pseudomonadota bacterium]
MATLVLSAAGQAVGGFLGPVGAIVGRAAGALAGHVIDQRLFGDNRTRSVGQIDDLTVQTSSEGNAIPRVYGRMRLAGTVIWARDFTEHSRTHTGGKGGGPSVREYAYTADFAVAICEGPVARIGRVWADGEPLDLTKIEMRTYFGTDDQAADPLIEGVEGVAPAYRGLAYVVFEGLPIGVFGNRLPQITFEVVRPVGRVEAGLRGVTMIPGATEFGYSPTEVKRVVGPGERASDNRHLGVAASDFEASLDDLVASCPNLESVALVVSWFGDDLRAGSCTLQPGVEARDRVLDASWAVAGETRATAKLVSADDFDRPSYGGTPSDQSVFDAVKAIRARGLKVVFYPFILMDVPEGNGLPDPYGGAEQATFPWRGRITVLPDGTAAADQDVAAFLGDAAAADFSGAGASVVYSGPAEWSLRRMVLHYARLCAQAGGVDAFLIGSELRGLTTVRGAAGYPAAQGLSDLADDVRLLVGGGTKISYAADWSEFFGHQPGNGDVSFHLDGLWANPNVDFIGIDNYWPLSDWRDGAHLDAAGAASTYAPDYLQSNVAGGEGFDWYYASDGDRVSQIRTPITDGAYGKDWVFRYKDLKGWWENQHFDRVAGVELAQPTGWVPQSKPFWFTEFGCPAVDRGANQPNVFVDPKSSESALPYFSSGRRDDQIQRSYLEAMLSAFDPAFGDVDQSNPQSSQYVGRMVDPSGMHAWTWDARPWPAFPQRSDVWSDGANWARGHWLTGRIGGAPFGELVSALFADWGAPAPDVLEAGGPTLDGFVVSAPQSLRSVLEPLTAAVSVVGADTGVGVRFVSLTREPTEVIDTDRMLDPGERGALLAETRDEEGALPIEQRLRYFDSGREYRVAAARYRPPEGATRQIEEISLSGTLNDGLAAELCEIALAARWSGRTTLKFALAPNEIALLPGDVVTVRADGRDRDVIVEEIEDLDRREVTARSLDRTALSPTVTPGSPVPPVAPPTSAPPVAFGLNLPIVDEGVAAHAPWIAAFARPFPQMGVWRQAGTGAFELLRTIDAPATVGAVVGAPGAGPTSRWDFGNSIDVQLFRGALQSKERLAVLDGANAVAVATANGGFEVFQFRDAALIGQRTYRLSGLLRGQIGTEDAAASGILVGASVVVLDGTLAVLDLPLAQVGQTRTYRVGPLADGIGGEDTTTFSFTATGRGLLPFSPVHVRARADAGGALALTWIRRTRIGGDQWPDGGDVPLGEADELYRVEILDGLNVVRAAEVSVQGFDYSLADQTADFGGAQSQLTVRVAQIAPGFGPGVPTEVTVDVQQS